ncbi:MAG: class I SAM-dependent methyltransferase [Actinomycetota bacterium]|nr:class I SAM-dependent methyltransferase [Actinomycetota bacterium]
MTEGLYKRDPLTPDEREEYETDLIAFCDHELDLLGDIRGLNVLYAGGCSPLWLEGLSQRIGESGTLFALESDETRVDEGRELLGEADLAASVRLVVGDVFQPPFAWDAFDLAYSAGLFHELDASVSGLGDALLALASVVRPGGRVATSDFVDSVAAAQLEEEELQRDLARKIGGVEYYGISSPEHLVALHQSLLTDVRWQVSPPRPIRHLSKVVFTEEPEELRGLSAGMQWELRERYEALRNRILREGYTRLATVYVEGLVPER